jgi:hypothetical protein
MTAAIVPIVASRCDSGELVPQIFELFLRGGDLSLEMLVVGLRGRWFAAHGPFYRRRATATLIRGHSMWTCDVIGPGKVGAYTRGRAR